VHSRSVASNAERSFDERDHIKESIGVLHRRSYFYVGGAYSAVENGSAPDAAISSGQMYVEHLVPQEIRRKYPIVMIHGNGMFWFQSLGMSMLKVHFYRDDGNQLSQYT